MKMPGDGEVGMLGRAGRAIGAALWLVLGAWLIGLVPVFVFGLLNLMVSFLFDVRYLPKELMGSESEVAVLVIVIPLTIGSALMIGWAWFTSSSIEPDDTDGLAQGETRNPVQDLDAFGVSCFRTQLVQEFDPRTSRDFERIAAIDDAVKRGDDVRAFELACAASSDHADSFLFPCRAADIKVRNGEFDVAEQVLRAALETSLSKADICERLGTIAHNRGKAIEAIRWWIIASHLQLSSGRLVQYQPFLKLSYVAGGLDWTPEQKFLKYKSDQTSPLNSIDLNDQAAMELRRIADELSPDDRNSVCKALTFLVGGRSAPDQYKSEISSDPISGYAYDAEQHGLSCPLCNQLMIVEPNHVHCESGHSKVVVNPQGGSFLARSEDVAEALKAQGFRVENGGGDRPMYTIFPR